MPRPERVLDSSAGPVQQFAADLRAVRHKAGNPKYLQMARATGRSRTALAEAAGGDHLATWETVQAYLRACGEDPDAWLGRWEAVRAGIDRERSGATSAGASASETPEDAGQAPVAERTRRRLSVGVGVVVVAAASVATGFALASGHGASGSVPPPDGTVTVYVQNKVASGSNGFYEDDTPVYLSTKMEPMCARNGCKVPGTEMWSGVPLQALCQAQGYALSNANLHSDGIQQNPNAITSSRWYRVMTSSGITGYIAEAYLTPASRGGLGLPTCPPG